MTDDLLTLRNLRVMVGERLLLKDISLSFPAVGFFVVMGPVGVGKSTLMSVFEGKRTADVVTTEADEATFYGQPLSKNNHPYVIRQATRSEQMARAVSTRTIRGQIAEALAQNPRMLCLDEPCAMVAHEEAMPILEQLKDEAQKRAIVMVTHNSEHARLFADWMVLLGSGQIIEAGSPDKMFNAPESNVTKQFLKTGGMAIPRPDAAARTLAPEFRGMPDLGTDTGDTADGPIIWIVRRSFAVATEAFSASNNAEMLEEMAHQGITVAVVNSETDTGLSTTLEAAGVRVIMTPHQPANKPKDIRKHLSMISHIQSEINQGHKVLVMGTDQAKTKMIAAIFLIQMGITVHDSLSILNTKVKGCPFSMNEEQFLWDLELVLDMESTSDSMTQKMYQA